MIKFKLLSVSHYVGKLVFAMVCLSIYQYLKDFYDEIAGNTNTCGFGVFKKYSIWKSKNLADLYIPVNCYFPNDQYIVLQNNAWGKYLNRPLDFM